jgi:hypothetical protein
MPSPHARVSARRALSRIYAGGHLPIDVIGGAALGVLVSESVMAQARLRLFASTARRNSRRSSTLGRSAAEHDVDDLLQPANAAGVEHVVATRDQQEKQRRAAYDRLSCSHPISLLAGGALAEYRGCDYCRKTLGSGRTICMTRGG